MNMQRTYMVYEVDLVTQLRTPQPLVAWNTWTVRDVVDGLIEVLPQGTDAYERYPHKFWTFFLKDKEGDLILMELETDNTYRLNFSDGGYEILTWDSGVTPSLYAKLNPEQTFTVSILTDQNVWEDVDSWL